MSYIRLNGEEIYYTQLGNTNSSETLLMMHGGTLNSNSMLHIAAGFEDYNCVLFDLPAHGKSTGKNRVTINEWSIFTEELIKTLKGLGVITESLTVIGYSMTASVAIELAINKVKEIKRIVVLSGCADGDVYSPIKEVLSQYTRENFEYLGVFNTGVIEKLDSLSETQLEITKIMEPAPICYDDLLAIAVYNNLERTKNIEIPVLIIAGDMDLTTPVICAMHLREFIPTSSLTVIPYVGHSVIYKSPAYVIETIKKFLIHQCNIWAQFEDVEIH